MSDGHLQPLQIVHQNNHSYAIPFTGNFQKAILDVITERRMYREEDLHEFFQDILQSPQEWISQFGFQTSEVPKSVVERVIMNLRKELFLD